VAVVGKLVQNRKETAIYKRINNTQNKTKKQNIQKENKFKNNIKKHKSIS